MNLQFSSTSSILDVEAHFHKFPARQEAQGVINLYQSDDWSDDLNWPCTLQRVNKGWKITTPTSGAEVFFRKNPKGGIEVEYHGPFAGLGHSPFMPNINYSGLLRGQVIATDFRGNMKQYLEHRLRYLQVLYEEHSDGRPTVRGHRCPKPIEELGWALYISYTSAVEGFEDKWPGTDPSLYWAKTPNPKKGREHVRLSNNWNALWGQHVPRTVLDKL